MKKSILILLMFFLFVISSFAQDIYNISNSKKYADFTYKNHDFKTAAKEYERVYFMGNQSDSIRLLVIHSLKKALLFDEAIGKLNYFFPDKNKMPVSAAKEYISLLLNSDSISKTIDFANKYELFSKSEKNFFIINAELFSGNIQNAKTIFSLTQENSFPKYGEYNFLLKDKKLLNKKSSILAASMSALVPGAGKFYSGEWRDGLISFILIATSAYQSYRGFDKVGNKSVYGWIYAGIGTGFYLGNIYGAVKSAKRHNKNVKNKIHKQAEMLYNSVNYNN